MWPALSCEEMVANLWRQRFWRTVESAANSTSQSQMSNKSAGHAIRSFSVQTAIMDNRDRFVIRDGWLRKLHHRRQMALDGRIKCNPVGIFGKWCRPYRGRARPVQIR